MRVPKRTRMAIQWYPIVKIAISPLKKKIRGIKEREFCLSKSWKICSRKRRQTYLVSEFSAQNYFQHPFPSTEFFGSSGNPPSRLVVGLVGYPNVGKSSTINSLLGEKKVSVSSTPGKTKHFQTINFTDNITLCDCPGLVFPQFTTTKADLVCDGVLPIDQLREHIGPTGLVVKRIPRNVLEATYGLRVKVQGIEEGGDGQLTAENFLIAYASKRTFPF